MRCIGDGLSVITDLTMKTAVAIRQVRNPPVAYGLNLGANLLDQAQIAPALTCLTA